MASAGVLDGLSELSRKRPASALQGPLGVLPPELLGDIVERAAELDGPLKPAVRQLATLKAVNKAFRFAASDVPEETPAQRETVTQTVRHAIKDAMCEWSRSSGAPADKERIGARLANTLQNLGQVIVNLGDIRVPWGSPGGQDWSGRERKGALMVQVVLDVLAAHPRLASLEVAAATEHLQSLAALTGRRPELLRSLEVSLRKPRLQARNHTELIQMLNGQKNLTKLTLRDELGGQGRIHLDLRAGGLDHAIASLPGLKSLTLSHCEMTQDDSAALSDVLLKLPALEQLNLSHAKLDAASVERIASSLPALPRLCGLSLLGTSLAGASARHLTQVLPNLERMQTLDLGSTELVATDMAHLARGLSGMKLLQTLDVSHNVLEQDGRSILIDALARVPTLRHLYLRARWHEQPPDLDTLKEDLAPLKGNPELHAYLLVLDRYDARSKPRMDKVLAEVEVPRVHFIE